MPVPTLSLLSRARTRTRVGVLGVLVLLACALAPGFAVQADASEPVVERIEGADRFATAAAAAAITNPDGAEQVILAAGYDFPDSLAAAGLSGLRDAPILLVDDLRGALPTATSAALTSLDPDVVLIAGGPAAVDEAIVEALEAEGWLTERLAGPDRYATAARMAEAFAPGDVAQATAILATGRTAADALSAGPVAAGGPHPVLLTAGEMLPEATAAALTDLGIDRVLVAGGESAVGAGVVTEVEDLLGPDSVTRLEGADRFATAVAIAEHDPGLRDSEEILLATGYGPRNAAGVNVPADALVAALYGGQTASPLLPVHDVADALPGAVEAFIADRSLQVTKVTVLGGPGAISESVVGAAAVAADAGVEGPAVVFGEAEGFAESLDEPFDVRVFVLDEAGVPVVGQDVALERSRLTDDGDTATDTSTVTTDASGRASVTVDPPGRTAEDRIVATAATEDGELTAEGRIAWSAAGVRNADTEGDGLLALAEDALLARQGWSPDPANDAIAGAAEGDTLEMLGMHAYHGPDEAIDVDRPLTLTGDATIRGGGFTALTVTAPGVTLEGLEVRHSGPGVPHAVLVELDAEDAGILLEGLTVVGLGGGDTSGITVTNDGGALSDVTIRGCTSSGFATPVFVTEIAALPREPMTPIDIGGDLSDITVEGSTLTDGGVALLAGLFDEDAEDTPDVTVTDNILAPDDVGLWINGRVDPDQVLGNVVEGGTGRFIVVRGGVDDAAAERLATDLVPRNTLPASNVFHLGEDDFGFGPGIEGWVIGEAP